jgi:glycerol 2-dehydrogenase (NADP+)
MTANAPVVAYGTWVSSPDEAPQMIERVKMALAAGFRHIDTAHNYRTEQYVIQAMKESGLRRDQIFLTSKVETPPLPATMQLVLGSVGHYDLLLLHGPPRARTREEFKEKVFHLWAQMHTYVKLGLVRMIGVSNFYRTQLDLLLEVCEQFELYLPVVNQIEIHIWNLELEYVSYLKSLDIVVFAHTPLGGLGAKWFLQDETLNRIATRLGTTPAQVMFSYLLGRQIGVVTSSKNMDHMREFFQDVKLTREDMEAINQLDNKEGQGRVIDSTQEIWAQELMLR